MLPEGCYWGTSSYVKRKIILESMCVMTESLSQVLVET